MDKLQNPVDFLEDINNKYADLEHELDQKLRKMYVFHFKVNRGKHLFNVNWLS